MSEEKRSKARNPRLAGAIWGAILGILLGTAVSSALAPVVPEGLLKTLLVGGVKVGIPQIGTSLGFFDLTFGFSLRFTLLSGFFMLLVGGLMLVLPFKKDS